MPPAAKWLVPSSGSAPAIFRASRAGDAGFFEVEGNGGVDRGQLFLENAEDSRVGLLIGCCDKFLLVFVERLDFARQPHGDDFAGAG